MAFSKPVTLLCLALSLICCLAIPDEYDGFLHYHQVDATQDQVWFDWLSTADASTCQIEAS